MAGFRNAARRVPCWKAAALVVASSWIAAAAEAAMLQVGRDCRTLQECVDAAPDRSAIRVPPGRYTGPVEVSDKTLRLVGSRRAPAELAPPETSFAVRATRARLTLRNLRLRGGHGARVDGGSLVARSVTFEDSDEHGLVASESLVRLVKAVMRGHGYYGVQATASLVSLKQVTIEAPGGDGIGVYIDNRYDPALLFPADEGSDGSFEHLVVNGHPSGGMVIVGSWFDYAVRKSTFFLNGRFGLYLAGADDTVVDESSFSFTFVHPIGDPVGDDLADGVVVSDSSGVIASMLDVHDNERAGIVAVASDGVIEDSVVTLNEYGVVLQETTPATMIGDGNQVSGNAAQDIVLDGPLPVPSEPLAIPPSP